VKRLNATWAGADGPWLWFDDQGRALAELWRASVDWPCRGADGRAVRVQARLIGTEAIALPVLALDQPVPVALAALVHAVRGHGALVALERPGEVLQQGVGAAEGIRLLAVYDEADEAAWDALVSGGQPTYAVRDRLAMWMDQPDPSMVLSSLAFGGFICHRNLPLTHFEEDRTGVAYIADRPTTATVLIKDSFEAGRLIGSPGATVRWTDGGREGVVRLCITDESGGCCWSQPRMVVPRRS
jgi:hypothetical protein